MALRVAEIIKYPKIAQDFGSDSRRGKGRIVVLCNLFHNAEAGPKDKQDWIIIFSAALRKASICASKVRLGDILK